MEKLDRNTLKNKFKKGQMPAEQDFSNLIDSMVNILEEGFDKSREDGLRITQLTGSRLLSFYENIAVGNSKWFLELGTGGDQLHFGTQSTPRVLSLRSYTETVEGQSLEKIAVGINKEIPEATLDVDGTIMANGRLGKPGEFLAPANGEWQDITAVLTGCQSFEIMAGVGGQDSDGKFALLHAIALNTFNGKSSIKYQQSHFGAKCNRLEIRWLAVPEQGPFYFKLQIRVLCSYGKDVWIKYHVTQLWFDSLMRGSIKIPDNRVY